jgi:lipopolysaccharide biosynthesis glycosyltransferase
MARIHSKKQFELAIAVAADAAYLWPGVLALISAGARSTLPTICLLIGDQLSAEQVATAEDVFAHHGLLFQCVQVDLGEFSSFPLGLWYSRATYARLYVPEIAARFASRTLYLDADTLTVGDAAALTEVNFGEEHVLGAVHSSTIPTLEGAVADWEERGLDPTASAFNGGVLLIDNDRWIRHGISAQVASGLRRKPEAARFADQGALNAVLHDRWTALPAGWNCEIWRRPAVRLGPFVLSRTSCQSLRQARILHYFQDVKPWQPDYPPGYFGSVYRRAWERFLPVPPPPLQSYRRWLRLRYLGRRR